MSLKEIAFIANWARNNKHVVKLIANNTKWLELGIQEILLDLENKASEAISFDSVISVQVPSYTTISNKKNKDLKQDAYSYSK